MKLLALSTTTPRGSAALLDATVGADPGAPWAAPDLGGPLLPSLARPPQRALADRASRLNRSSISGCRMCTACTSLIATRLPISVCLPS